MPSEVYPRAVWRLIVDDGPRPGDWNMALDRAIADAVAEGVAPPTLRFYAWRPTCLSMGRRQPLDGVDLPRCASDGVDVVRRPTGGWAILHADELTYSVAARGDDPRTTGAVLDAYRKLSAGLLAGLRRLGADASMTPEDPFGVHNTSAACFEVPSAYEITVTGRKLMGSAQTRSQGRVLQHGSLPLDGDIARVARYLAYANEDERERLRLHLSERAATLSDVVGHRVSFEQAAEAMSAGFASALNLELVPTQYTAAELVTAESLLAEMRVDVRAGATSERRD
jgi:lipoyl(octanoyl) transferase